MHKSNIYKPDGVIKRIKEKITFDILDVNQSQYKLKSILFEVLQEMREDAFNYDTKEERLNFISDSLKTIKESYVGDLDHNDKFVKCLNSIKKEFISEVEKLKEFLEHFPVKYKSSNKSVIINTIEKPLAFIGDLKSVEFINDLKEEFYLLNDILGYSVDRKQESVSLSFLNEDFGDLEFDSLDAIKKEESLLRINHPSNTNRITCHFKDELERLVIQNIENSKEVIKKGLLHNTNKQEEYLEELNKVLIHLTSTTCESLKKYSKARKEIKDFKEEISKKDADLFLSNIPVAHQFNPNLTFSSNLHPKNFISFYKKLIVAKLIDCKFNDLVFVLKGSQINKKIQWKRFDNTLYYLISEMISRKIINADFKANKTEQWKVVENCFLNRKGKAFKAYKLRLLKEPSDKTLLNDILSLIKTT